MQARLIGCSTVCPAKAALHHLLPRSQDACRVRIAPIYSRPYVYQSAHTCSVPILHLQNAHRRVHHPKSVRPVPLPTTVLLICHAVRTDACPSNSTVPALPLALPALHSQATGWYPSSALPPRPTYNIHPHRPLPARRSTCRQPLPPRSRSGLSPDGPDAAECGQACRAGPRDPTPSGPCIGADAIPICVSALLQPALLRQNSTYRAS